MSAGACRACVIDRKCHPKAAPCWCCSDTLPPFKTLQQIDRAKVLPGLVELLRSRPDLARPVAWFDGLSLGRVLRDGILS